MNEKELTTEQTLNLILEKITNIEADIREIRSHISRIDGNVEILATSTGFPYSHKDRRVYSFDRKVS